MRRHCVAACVLVCVLVVAACTAPTTARAADKVPPTDNPVATYYDGDRGYPAWTDRIRWDRVIDMSAYEKGFRRGWGRDLWPGKAKVSQPGQTVKLRVELDVVDKDYPGKAAFDVTLKQDGDVLSGSFSGKCRDQATRGDVTGRMLTITPETPREWNLVGLMPDKGKPIKDVDTVGICWVQLVGGTVWFGPDVEWGSTWATAGSWKSD